MAFNLSVKLVPETVRSLAGAAIGAAYMGIGTAFEHPVRIIMIQNLTDQIVMFSFNGIDDHVPLPANGFLLLDVMANKSSPGGGFYIAEGTRIYAKDAGVSPSTGFVYVSVFYGYDN